MIFGSVYCLCRTSSILRWPERCQYVCVASTLSHRAYPIHCSAGGKLGGFTTKGDSRRCINSSGVYRVAMTTDEFEASFCFVPKTHMILGAGREGDGVPG